MLHQAHHGWRKFPSSRTTTMSRTCRCKKCTRIAVLVATRPGHPSTGKFCGPPFAGKFIPKVWGPAPRGQGDPSPSCFHHPHILSHHMTRQGYRHQQISARSAWHLSLQPLPVHKALPCDPPPIRCFRQVPCRLTGVEDHDDCLPDICLQAHPIKYSNQGVERTL